MATPSQFFTALAQVSAAIIAFVIAISSVLYSIERERREQRTERLRESMFDFKGHSEKSLLKLIRMIEDSASNGYYLRELKGQLDRQKRMINKGTSRTMTAHAFLSILTSRLWEIKGHLSPSEMDELIVEISQNHHELDLRFNRENKFNRELYQELTDSTDEETPEEYLLEQGVLGSNDEELVQWVNDEVEKHDVTLYHPHNPGEDVSFAGSELYLAFVILAVTRPLLDALKADKERTLIGYEPQITRILRLSVILLLVGVALPLAFLLTPPPVILSFSTSLPLWFVFIAEMILLALSLFILIPLLELPLRQLSGEDDEDLSRISRIIIRMTTGSRSDISPGSAELHPRIVGSGSTDDDPPSDDDNDDSDRGLSVADG